MGTIEIDNGIKEKVKEHLRQFNQDDSDEAITSLVEDLISEELERYKDRLG